jgi:L-asparagine transporter-like permease
MFSIIINYLFIGVFWVFLLDVIGYLLKSNNNLTPLEKVVTSLFWPITFIIFTYYFIKTFIDGSN